MKAGVMDEAIANERHISTSSCDPRGVRKRSSHAKNTSSTFNKTTTTRKTNGMCWNETDTGWGSEGVELRQRGGAHDTRGGGA